MIVPNRWIRAVLVLVAVFALAVSASQAQTAREVAKKTSPSVVMLLMEDQNGQPLSLGSGFIVREGIIATNRHVVEGASRGYAKLAGQKEKHNIEGTVGVNTFADLVLLSCKALKRDTASLGEKPQSPKLNVRPLPLGDSSLVEVGDEVYVVGNPMGLEGTISRGIVSGIRQIEEKDKLFQITAPISPGSSGGPVLNTKAEVIGVAVATFRGGQNLNFAVPVSYLSSLLANTKPLKPLSSKKQSSEESVKSIFGDLGKRNTEGVKAAAFLWYSEVAQIGYYTFSLRNLLREPVRNVYCLVIFYDKSGEPLDVDVVRCSEIIPAGLARRVESNVDGSVQELTTRKGSGTPFTKFEIRILSFDFVESTGARELSQSPKLPAHNLPKLKNFDEQRRKQLKKLEEARASLRQSQQRLQKARAGKDAPHSADTYAFVGSDHWIQEVSGSGSIIKLEDGSIWEVSPIDVINSALWLPVSEITVIKSKNPLYPYILINTDDGEKVEAQLLFAGITSTDDANRDNQNTADLIESRIEGDFEGWEGDTIFKLENGQIWEQASYGYKYSYKSRPKVFIFKTDGGYKMKVVGVSGTIFVKQLK